MPRASAAPAPALAIVIACVALAASAASFWTSQFGAPAVQNLPDSAASARIEALEEQVRRLAAQLELPGAAPAVAPADTGAAREALSTSSTASSNPSTQAPDFDARLKARLAALESTVSHLRSVELAIGAMPSDLPGVLRAMADKNLRGNDVAPELRQRRMDLQRRLLELAPEHESAGSALLDLANDHILTDPRAGLAALDQFGSLVTLPAWQLAKTRANLLGRLGERDQERAIYDTIQRDPATPEGERASARFWHAHSFYEQGRYQEAAAGFDALIREFATRPGIDVERTVASARTYLERCQKELEGR